MLKFTHFLYDYEGYKAQLYFLRNYDQKEVDFLVCIDEKPWFAVEVKSNQVKVSPQLKYFGKKLNIPFLYQVVKIADIDKVINNIRVLSADRFLMGLM